MLKIATERREKDNRDRWMATRALGIIGGKSIVPELIPLLYHYNQNTRFWAQISLVRLTKVNFEADWEAWAKWWNEKMGKPKFEGPKVTWTTRPDWAEYADPKKQAENDRRVIESLRKKMAGDTASGREKLRVNFTNRMAKDRQIYTNEQLGQIERLYQVGNKSWGSDEAKENLRKVIAQYGQANRAGCAALYLGQLSKGEEKEQYLKMAIEKYNDCWYGDGVQVGAYARFYLAHYYRQIGKQQEAQKLDKELTEQYPNAVNHRGELLSDIIGNNKKTEVSSNSGQPVDSSNRDKKKAIRDLGQLLEGFDISSDQADKEKLKLAFENALLFVELSADGYYLASKAADVLNKPQAALEMLQKAVSQHPEDNAGGMSLPVKITANFRIGRIARYERDVERAKWAYQSIINNCEGIEMEAFCRTMCYMYLAEIAGVIEKNRDKTIKALVVMKDKIVSL